MSPTVSVNLCCYNSEKYLRETLDSIINQTYKDWELVIINDGSIDSTELIIKGYIDKGYPILYHYQENRGLSYSRNKALDLSSGDYIALIDHDDVWLPDKLTKQVHAMEENKDYALCYGGVIVIDDTGRKREIGKPKYNSGNIFEKLLYQFDVNVPTSFLRSSTLKNAGLKFDENITASEEYCLFMQLAVKHKFLILNDILAKYRIHDAALTAKSIHKWAIERTYTLDLINTNHPLIREQYSEAFKEAYARASYYRARFYIFNREKIKALNELRKVMFLNYRYFLLLILAMLPKSFWDWVHRFRTYRDV